MLPGETPRSLLLGAYYYYWINKENDGIPPEQVRVNGSVSMMDLNKNIITSLYGYYGDEWVQISLGQYF